AQRFAGRSGPLRLLVVGGSLGARALNDIVPQALALIPAAQRPRVLHQSGAAQIEALRANYTAAGVLAELTPFIEDTAQAFAEADLILCRAGASTVTEIAAVGAAAVFVPFPAAVDDHQSANARFLVDQGAGLLLPQQDMTPEKLAGMLQAAERGTLLRWAERAQQLARTDATERMVSACEELAR
ncbi:MAG: glycosyltransferase, partial [Curvibacter sp.]